MAKNKLPKTGSILQASHDLVNDNPVQHIDENDTNIVSNTNNRDYESEIATLERAKVGKSQREIADIDKKIAAIKAEQQGFTELQNSILQDGTDPLTGTDTAARTGVDGKVTVENKFDDQKAVGATLDELKYMYENGQISKAAYEKRLLELQNISPEEKAAVDEGTRKAEETLSEGDLIDTTDTNNITEEIVEEADPVTKKRYANTTMGIWDAYRNKDIDLGTAMYFTLDAISNFARNTGKDIGNIAAAFSGGTMDNSDRSKSMWQQRRDAMFENELGSELESDEGSRAWRAAQHDFNSLTSEQQNIVAKNIENWIAKNTKHLTVEGLQKQIEAMGYNNLALKLNTMMDEDLINAYKNGNATDKVLAVLGRAVQKGVSANTPVGSFSFGK